MLLQINPNVGDITSMLSIESITVAGLLLVLCVYLIWEKNQQRKKYEQDLKDLLKRLNDESDENKTALIDLVTRSILAAEQNTKAIIDIKDVLNNK